MSNFTESVEHYLDGLDAVSAGACNACEECMDGHAEGEECALDSANEGSFSWQQCDSCGSTFGGDRYPGHALLGERQELLHLDICTDCLLYLANGDEPGQWQQHPK